MLENAMRKEGLLHLDVCSFLSRRAYITKIGAVLAKIGAVLANVTYRWSFARERSGFYVLH